MMMMMMMMIIVILVSLLLVIFIKLWLFSLNIAVVKTFLIFYSFDLLAFSFHVRIEGAAELMKL